MCSNRQACGLYPRLTLGLHIDDLKRGRGLGDDDHVALHFDVEVNLNDGITHGRESACQKEAPYRGDENGASTLLMDCMGWGEPTRRWLARLRDNFKLD